MRTPDIHGRLRAWWLHRQGLTPATAPTTIAACVRQTGWMVTAGSTGVYLSIRARMRGVSREAIDRAVLDGTTVMEVPGAHARPWVLVPRDEAALALRLHLRSYEAHAAAYYRYAGITEATVKGVAAQVCAALDEGPLSSADIRKQVTHPDAGELLVGALVHLSIRGIVRRISLDGRLDSSSYVYELRHPDDRPALESAGDESRVIARCIDGFLRCHGPATIDELCWWGTLPKGAVRTALQSLGAESVAVPGWAEHAWLPADDAIRWRQSKGDEGDRVVLLPYRDPFVLGRRPPAILTRMPEATVLDDKLKRVPVNAIDALRHHVILRGSDVIGVWEYDPESEAVVARIWKKGDPQLRRRVADAAGETSQFIRQQLGDLKLSAVDPPARRARRIAFCASK
jgi:hypothetical protein